MPDTQPPRALTTTPILHRCPDCGGILDQTVPPWQALAHPDAVRIRPTDTGGWQCLICGYRRVKL